jgi:hypothetical protein
MAKRKKFGGTLTKHMAKAAEAGTFVPAPPNSPPAAVAAVDVDADTTTVTETAEAPPAPPPIVMNLRQPALRLATIAPAENADDDFPDDEEDVAEIYAPASPPPATAAAPAAPPAMLLSATPGSRGIFIDLPAEIADEYLRQASNFGVSLPAILADRLRLSISHTSVRGLHIDDPGRVRLGRLLNIPCLAQEEVIGAIEALVRIRLSGGVPQIPIDCFFDLDTARAIHYGATALNQSFEDRARQLALAGLHRVKVGG